MEADEAGRLIGAHRAVLRLAKRTGLPVGRADIDVLVRQGAMSPAGSFNGFPTYDVADLDGLPSDLIREVVEARLSWLRVSVDERTAASRLGVPLRQLKVVAAEAAVTAGRFGRYAEVDVAALVQRRSVASAVTESEAAARCAARMLDEGVAVILDTETATLDGQICEIAVVEASSGEVLLDTLVNPGAPVSEAAQRVHGLGDLALANAPGWPEVLPEVLRHTRGRVIVAYNSEFDRQVICSECQRCHRDPEHFGDARNWCCLMTLRTVRLGLLRALPLGGPHRALADCRAAWEVLHGLARS